MTNRYLALDYGLQHTGIALATSPLAQPLTTIPTSSLSDQLPKLIATHHITHLIVGLSENVFATTTQALVAKLTEQLAIPVITHDETLTTLEAHVKLAHTKRKVKHGPDHHFAAALILQDYLDTHPHEI